MSSFVQPMRSRTTSSPVIPYSRNLGAAASVVVARTEIEHASSDPDGLGGSPKRKGITQSTSLCNFRSTSDDHEGRAIGHVADGSSTSLSSNTSTSSRRMKPSLSVSLVPQFSALAAFNLKTNQGCGSPQSADPTAQPQDPFLSIGSIDHRQFASIQSLGFGSGGSVVKVKHLPSGKFMARKTITNETNTSTEAHVAARKELDILRSVSHPNIVSFFGSYLYDGELVIVMEYMDAGSLSSLLAQSGAIPENVVQCIAASLVSALKYLAARHVVHRDLKPANILLNTQGEVKLTDFGVSKNSELSAPKTFTGTHGYLAPEKLGIPVSNEFPRSAGIRSDQGNGVVFDWIPKESIAITPNNNNSAVVAANTSTTTNSLTPAFGSSNGVNNGRVFKSDVLSRPRRQSKVDITASYLELNDSSVEKHVVGPIISVNQQTTSSKPPLANGGVSSTSSVITGINSKKSSTDQQQQPQQQQSLQQQQPQLSPQHQPSSFATSMRKRVAAALNSRQQMSSIEQQQLQQIQQLQHGKKEVVLEDDVLEIDNELSKGDIWSLGITLYEILYEFPYSRYPTIMDIIKAVQDEPQPKLPDHFSEGCRSFVSSCLSKDVKTRFGVNECYKHSWISEVLNRGSTYIPQSREFDIPRPQLNTSNMENTRIQTPRMGSQFKVQLETIVSPGPHSKVNSPTSSPHSPITSATNNNNNALLINSATLLKPISASGNHGISSLSAVSSNEGTIKFTRSPDDVALVPTASPQPSILGTSNVSETETNNIHHPVALVFDNSYFSKMTKTRLTKSDGDLSPSIIDEVVLRTQNDEGKMDIDVVTNTTTNDSVSSLSLHRVSLSDSESLNAADDEHRDSDEDGTPSEEKQMMTLEEELALGRQFQLESIVSSTINSSITRNSSTITNIVTRRSREHGEMDGTNQLTNVLSVEELVENGLAIHDDPSLIELSPTSRPQLPKRQKSVKHKNDNDFSKKNNNAVYTDVPVVLSSSVVTASLKSPSPTTTVVNGTCQHGLPSKDTPTDSGISLAQDKVVTRSLNCQLVEEWLKKVSSGEIRRAPLSPGVTSESTIQDVRNALSAGKGIRSPTPLNLEDELMKCGNSSSSRTSPTLLSGIVSQKATSTSRSGAEKKN